MHDNVNNRGGAKRAMAIDQVARQLGQLGVQRIDSRLLLDNFRNAFIQARSSLPDPLDGFQASAEIAAPLAQLRVQLGSGRFVPKLHLAERCFVHHAQPGGQRPHQAV